MGFVSISSEKSLTESCGAAEFEFLLTSTSLDSMLSADELFREGKLWPKFWLAEHCDDKSLDKDGGSLMIESRPWKDGGEKEEEERRSCNMNPDWFVDEDPSPRPPNCTILWKELLRLRKQRTASSSPLCPSSLMLLSPSSSSLSTSSSSSSMTDVAAKEGKDSGKSAKRMKKGGGAGEDHEDQADDQRADMYGGKSQQVAAASFPLEEGESRVVITKNIL